MLEIHLLGTGGTMPLPERPLTALLARYNGKSYLIDCGEGTQTAIRKNGLSMKPIDMIFFTHFHADHIAGLPGLLLTMGKQGRTEPVTLVGGKGLAQIARSLCVIAPELPFKTEIVEIDGAETFTLRELAITAFTVDHSVPCFGYSIELRRAGKFNPEKARALGLEPRFWNKLQNGENVELDGKIFTPDMVMGAPREGLKATYCTDSRPTAGIIEHAKNSDLFICEGMYADEDKLDSAIEKKHMLFREAAESAKAAQVDRLWLTHYSPSLVNPQKYLPTVREIFPNTEAPANSMSIDLVFKD